MIIATLRQTLRQPEYLHVLINPLPVYGLAIAILALTITLFQRSRAAQVTALILIFVSALSIWPVSYFGEGGYDRALSLADDQGQAWLKVHAHRADEVGLVYYVLAAVALLAILLPIKWPKLSVALVALTLLCSLGALSAGIYISYAGGRIRHREFRSGPPPPVPAENRDS